MKSSAPSIHEAPRPTGFEVHRQATVWHLGARHFRHFRDLVIAAVATAMVCILSAFNGIEDLVKDLFGTLDADLAVVPQSGAVIPQAWGDHLADIPGVATWAPVLEDEVVVRADEAVRVATVLGVDARYRAVSHIDRAIVEGAYAVEDSAMTCGCLGLGVRSNWP